MDSFQLIRMEARTLALGPSPQINDKQQCYARGLSSWKLK